MKKKLQKNQKNPKKKRKSKKNTFLNTHHQTIVKIFICKKTHFQKKRFNKPYVRSTKNFKTCLNYICKNIFKHLFNPATKFVPKLKIIVFFVRTLEIPKAMKKPFHFQDS